MLRGFAEETKGISSGGKKITDFKDPTIYSREFKDEFERQFFNDLYNRFVEEFHLDGTDELIGLERVMKNYIKLRRAEAIVIAEGEAIRRETAEGREIILPHPLLSWIATWENQLRAWMKEMRFTRKEHSVTKTETKDLAVVLAGEWIKKKQPK